MGELSLLNLLGSGISNVTIVNRTLSKAKILAENTMFHMIHFQHYHLY